MADRPSKIIEDNPIGKGLGAFRASFDSIREDTGVSCLPDVLDQLGQEDIQNLTLDLLFALRNLPAIRLLRSKTGYGTLRNDLLKLNSAVSSDNFDFDRIRPLLNAALADNPNDALIWDRVYEAVTESTPPPRPISSVQETPWLRNTSSFANSSEYRKDVDNVLKEELGSMYVGIPGFHEKFFGGIPDLDTTSEAVFKRCMKGDNPQYSEGKWRGWPPDAKQEDVLSFFAQLSNQLAGFAEEFRSTPTHRRRPLAQANKPIQGSTAERKLDIGFVNDPNAGKDSRCHWSQILVPGELKSNPYADTAAKAWLDLGRYAREVLAAQDTRRFVLGFTLCGSFMRVWEFDRLGGIASERFDINEDGLRFVTTILGFLWMNEEQLGFDPTFMTGDGRRFIEIERNGQPERIIIDRLMKRAPCVAGRATTCWKAHREGDDSGTPLVIKDSWQYPEREEEGELLREATEKGVVNVARYYYHATVRLAGKDDDIQSNVRGGLDITKATNYRPDRSTSLQSTTATARKGRSGSANPRKRSSSHTDAPLPPTKRSCSTSPTKSGNTTPPNRIHRRVILRDYGQAIYKANSRASLLASLEGCIQGHESLRTKAGRLQRDISINNLILNEDETNPSWPSFLIDLDLAIKEQRDRSSGARGKTGTRAFMAIGVLLGEQHSFMHDLESFFWVLFWICVHYDGPNQERVIPQFDKWNYVDMEELAKLKLGTVAKEAIFMKTISDHFTAYYKPLIPLVNKLRKVVFPKDKPWEQEDERLYFQMGQVLQEGRKYST